MNPSRLTAALADRYRIERELGQGGMATVYLAEDLKHDRKVALKVLKPELAAVLGAERFVVEIKTTASLSHPHILPLFDSGTADGFLFYVMPFIEGETLRAKLDRETQLGVDEAVRITREVADALDYAHRHGVIHRDIKPENILLHDGRPMVADFGIALAVSAAAGGRMTETGLSLGTPHYMSPEQATAAKDITARSDVYSLGSVLYEMLAGEPPHGGGSAQAIIMRIIADVARPVTELRKSVPPNVAAAVAKALERVPADRFASAREFADALANPSFGAGTLASGRSATAGPGRRALSVRGVVIVAAVALVLGSAGTRLLWRGGVAPSPTSRLMLEFPAGEEPRYPNVLATPMLSQLPDGSGLLYLGRGTSAPAQLMLRRWNQISGTRLPYTIDDGCCVALSPQGDSVAYLAAPHALRVAPLGGGIPFTVTDSGLNSVTDWGGGVDWAEDGRLYASGIDGLIRVSPHGGPVEMVAPIDRKRGDLWYLWPVVLPGAAAALVTVVPAKDAADPAHFQIGVADFASGKVDILLQGLRAVYSPTGHLVVVKANRNLAAVPFDPASRHLTGRERELPDTVAVPGGFAELSLARSGTLVYARNVVRSFQAMWVDRTGNALPVAPDLKAVGMSDPSLSPAGDRLAITMIAVDGKQNIWVRSLNGGSKSRLTFEGVSNNRPAWRPGTGAISFGADSTATGLGTLLAERNADGSAGRRLLDVRERRTMGGGSWSPDGKWLVMRTSNQEAGNGDILAIRPGVDTVPRPIVATDAEEFSPAVSPDGRWLAYSSNESGRREVYVQTFPEAGGARYQVSNAGGITPVWGRNGREIFYIDGASNMVAVPVIPGPTFQTGEAQILFSAAGYELQAYFPQFDVTADGRRFVMVRGDSDPAVHVVVVFNFLAELKRLMASP